MAKPSRNSSTRRAYGFIKAYAGKYLVQTICEASDVTPSGCYAWLRKQMFISEHSWVAGLKPDIRK